MSDNEWRKLADHNPQVGDVFTNRTGDDLIIDSHSTARWDSWPPDVKSAGISEFNRSFRVVSRANAKPQPDYNDGNWHGWNGGECPVHPESLIIALFDDGSGCGKEEAADVYDWDYLPPVAFRVTKPYVEPKKPREWWIFTNGHGDLCVSASWRKDAIHVREVTDE